MINKSRSCFFEKINKINKPSTRLIKKKEREDPNKVRNERGEITIDTTEIQRIIRNYSCSRSWEEVQGESAGMVKWYLYMLAGSSGGTFFMTAPPLLNHPTKALSTNKITTGAQDFIKPWGDKSIWTLALIQTDNKLPISSEVMLSVAVTKNSKFLKEV